MERGAYSAPPVRWLYFKGYTFERSGWKRRERGKQRKGGRKGKVRRREREGEGGKGEGRGRKRRQK